MRIPYRYWQQLRTAVAWLGAICAMVVATTLWLNEGPAINTGDWDRVTLPAGFFAPPWEPMRAEYALTKPAHFANNGSMGAMLSALGSLSQYLGRTMLATMPIVAVLGLLLLVGVFFLVRPAHEPGQPLGSLLVLAALGLVLLCYAVFLKSLYGEAVVLALAPLLCVGMVQLVQHNRVLLFTLCAAAIICAKQQMLFVAPVFALLLLRNMGLYGVFSLRLWASLCGIAAVCAAMLLAHPENRAINQYNRYFNGVGWSLLHSADWPDRRFDERHPYFQKRQEQLRSVFSERLPQHQYLGTSYLPTASLLLDATKDPKIDAAQQAQAQALYNQLVEQGQFKRYVFTLAQHPELLWPLVQNTYRMTVRSNYILAYARSPGRWAASAFSAARTKVIAQLTGGFGGIFLGALLVALLVGRSLFCAMVVGWMLLAPLAVVAGDGFFEFEKHLAAYFVFLPCALMAAVLRPPPRAFLRY